MKELNAAHLWTGTPNHLKKHLLKTQEFLRVGLKQD